MQSIEEGNWVEIHQVILKPEARSSHLPEESKKVPYEMRARGFLLQAARLQETAHIQTLSGRIISGKLVQVEPRYDHGFGPPVYELMHIGEEEKQMLEK